MVTVEIKWNGREETMDERLNVVKGVINDLDKATKELTKE